MMALADFAIIMDRWFDCFNSTKLEQHPTKPLKSALGGENFDSQKKALLECVELVRDIRIGKHRVRIPWQNGVIIATKSLLGVFDMLKAQYGITHLMTRSEQGGN